MRSQRQAGLTGIYLGLFATVWFSVPAADGTLRVLLMVASIVALLTVAAGIAILVRAGRPAPGGRDQVADRRYLLIVAAEFAAAGLGALLLSVSGWSPYIPVLVAFVVGAHFLPLVEVLRDARLKLLGAAVCAVAVAALIAGLATSVAPGLVAGIGTGAALLGYAILALATAARR